MLRNISTKVQKRRTNMVLFFFALKNDKIGGNSNESTMSKGQNSAKFSRKI